MRLPGYLIAFVLGVLLATTTPVGTGAGVHQFDLLHPIFGHVHLVNGRILTHQQLAQQSRATEPARPGVNLGSDPGASPMDGGPGVSPSLPSPELLLAALIPDESLLSEPLPLRGREVAPPDPPPL
jgi:hypothetical protein